MLLSPEKYVFIIIPVNKQYYIFSDYLSPSVNADKISCLWIVYTYITFVLCNLLIIYNIVGAKRHVLYNQLNWLLSVVYETTIWKLHFFINTLLLECGFSLESCTYEGFNDFTCNRFSLKTIEQLMRLFKDVWVRTVLIMFHSVVKNITSICFGLRHKWLRNYLLFLDYISIVIFPTVQKIFSLYN